MKLFHPEIQSVLLAFKPKVAGSLMNLILTLRRLAYLAVLLDAKGRIISLEKMINQSHQSRR